jgi:hypothetical protein
MYGDLGCQNLGANDFCMLIEPSNTSHQIPPPWGRPPRLGWWHCSCLMLGLAEFGHSYLCRAWEGKGAHCNRAMRDFSDNAGQICSFVVNLLTALSNFIAEY